MAVKYTNKAKSTLTGSVGSGDLTFSVTDGSAFPAISAGDWCSIVVTKASGAYEIMRCTTRVANLFTVARAQEGTTAISFTAGDIVEMRVTKATLDALQSIYCTCTGTNTLTLTPVNISISSLMAGQEFTFTAQNTNSGAMTANVATLGTVAMTRDANTAIAAGEIVAGTIYTMVYNGTNFRVTNISKVSNADSLGGYSASLYPRLAAANTFTQPQNISVTGANTLSATSSAAGDSALENANTNAAGRAIIAARNTANTNAVLFAGYTSAGYAGSMNIGNGTFSFTSLGSTFYSVNASLRHDFNVGAGQVLNMSWAAGGHYFDSAVGYCSHNFVASSVIGFIGFTGTQFLYNYAWNFTSDARLKENVTPITDCLDRICSIDPVTFNFIGRTTTDIGVIAQQVQTVLPEAVNTFDKDGEEYLSVNYTGMLTVCLGAIKELRDKVNQLHADIDRLQG